MKVVHLCQSSDPNIGGSLTVARALLKAQRELGAEAWLVHLYEHQDSSLETATREFEITLGVPRNKRWTWGVTQLRALLGEMSPDVIHHHDGILWPRVASSRSPALHVTHGHLGRPDTSCLSASYWTHRYVAAHTDCLLAISPWVARSWIEGGFPEKRIRLVPNGVDCSRFYKRSPATRSKVRASLGLHDSERLLLWAGRLDLETKGLDRLVGVAQSLPDKVRLVVAGGGPSQQWLADMLQPLGAKVSLLGMVQSPEELFGCADAFLFTSRVEPFGLVLLEAAASSLPIFAFDCVGGGAPLLAELHSSMIKEIGSAEFHTAIGSPWRLLDPSIAEKVRSQYSWESAAKQTLSVYSEFLHQS